MATAENTILYRVSRNGWRGAHVDPVDAWYNADFIAPPQGVTMNGAKEVKTAIPQPWPAPDFDFTVVEERADEWPIAVRCLHGDPADWE